MNVNTTEGIKSNITGKNYYIFHSSHFLHKLCQFSEDSIISVSEFMDSYNCSDEICSSDEVSNDQNLLGKTSLDPAIDYLLARSYPIDC